MTGLDVRSVILIAGIMSLMMGVVLFFLKRNYPPSIQGLGEWAAAPMVLFAASLLFAARGAVPAFISILVANLTLFAGTSLLYFGTQRFFGLQPSIRLWAGLILVTLMPLAWFTVIEPHHGVRVAVIGSFMTLLALAHTRLILSRGSRTFSTYFAGAALLMLAVSQALRLASSFDLPASDGIFDNSSPAQGTYVSVYAFAILMSTIGMVLMATDKLRAELEHLATHDSLTGALNRRAVIEAGVLELARCRRNYKVMALLVMDLDHFKSINDTYGHQTGDAVLVDFASRVAHVLRQPDRFGRFGGEEFVVLLPETSLAEARVVAERIRAEVASGNKELPTCTVSIGVAVSGPDDLEMDGIVARADAAMYRAKEGGRNRVEAALP